MPPSRDFRRPVVLFACSSLMLGGTWIAPAAATPAAGGPPDSSSLTTPVLAGGRLLDAAGRPAAGMARLYAWPAWSPSDSPGTTTDLPIVAWSAAGPNGGFTLRAPSGWDANSENFVLFATSGDLRYERHLVSALPDGGARSAAAELLEIRFDPRSESVDRAPASAARSTGFVDMCHRQELGRYGGQETVVGELGTTEGVNGTFSYVTQADSTVSVAVRLGNHWGARGERHVSNQQTAKYIQDVRSPEQHSIDSFFTYVRSEVSCDGEGFATSEELSAEYWDGGGRLVPKHVPSCVGMEHSINQPAGSKFVRDRNRAQTWKGAAHVLGAEFSASSGFSTYVSSTWNFDYTQPDYTICGDDGYPAGSKRVFVGLDPAPSSCPKPGACPRAADER